MEKFRIKDTKQGITIEHTVFPKFEISVYLLESEAAWQGTLDDIFDLNIKRPPGKMLFQFLITEFNENDVSDPNDVGEDELHLYRRALQKAWKWMLHRYLLGNEALPRAPEMFYFGQDDDQDDFSTEIVDGIRYVTHLVKPVFRAKLKAEQDEMGIVEEVDFMEDVSPEEIASLMSKLGDWLSQGNL